jgi:uncharacterized FlgJ-related protein
MIPPSNQKRSDLIHPAMVASRTQVGKGWGMGRISREGSNRAGSRASGEEEIPDDWKYLAPLDQYFRNIQKTIAMPVAFS